MADNLESTGAEKIKPEDASFFDQMSEKAGELAEKAGDAWEKAEDKTEAMWDKVEDRAGELWEKAKNSDFANASQETLEDLKEGAKKLWDSVVDRFDGDSPEDKSEKPAP